MRSLHVQMPDVDRPSLVQVIQIRLLVCCWIVLSVSFLDSNMEAQASMSKLEPYLV